MQILTFAICLAAALLAPSVPAISPPGDELAVSVDLEVARQAGPLQVVGFKMPEEMGDAPVVVLRNVSAKATRSFWFDVRIGCGNSSDKPSSGGLGPWKNPQDPQWPKESTVAPSARGEAHLSALNGYVLVFSGRDHTCSCLRATVQVSAVEFADGSTWDRARATNSDPGPIDDAATQERLQPCQESQESDKVLKDLVGGGFRARAHGQADGTILRAYSVSCTLQQRADGAWLVRCPM
jgi:hypothetical protein